MDIICCILLVPIQLCDWSKKPNLTDLYMFCLDVKVVSSNPDFPFPRPSQREVYIKSLFWHRKMVAVKPRQSEKHFKGSNRKTEPVEKLHKEQGQGHDHEEPRPGRVQDEEDEVCGVEQMAEVEDLEVAAVPNERHRADHHHSQDHDQGNAGRIGDADDKSEQS